MKRLLALVLVLGVMASTLTACGKTKDKTTDITTNPETIRILGQSSNETNLNILRDQLTKAGFTVELNTQPDYSSYKSALATREWDLAVTGWTTVTGNPDYAVRDVFHSIGAYNDQPIVDTTVDTLIEKAASETPAQYKATYTELETHMVKDNAYILPLYATLRIQAINKDLIDETTVRQPKSRSGVWEKYSYVDAALNATRPLVMTQTSSVLTSLDPIQANDGSINQLSSNMNIRLVNLSDEDEVESAGSLSLNHAIAEGNSEYYFLLRDDVFFSKIEDKKAVNTGVRVGGEDVVFTLNRAKDKNSVALHKTYNLHSHMETIEVLTDMDELKTVLDSDTGKPVFETLTAGIDNEVTALTADKTKADNAKGVYQVVKIKTVNPFPQVLNYLAHQSAGIVSEQQVTAINSKFDVASYDATKDVCYGDFNYLKSTGNHLWMSGPYSLAYVNDYEVSFEKNPGYMVGTEYEPKIQTITSKFIKDNDSALSAFRSGEIDFLPTVAVTKVDLLEADAKFKVMKRSSNGVTYCTFNMDENNKFQDKDLRLAVLNAVDQAPFISVQNGLANPAYSTISTLIETGNVHAPDLAKSQEHLKAYQAK